MSAFESIDAFYASKHAPEIAKFGPDGGVASSGADAGPEAAKPPASTVRKTQVATPGKDDDAARRAAAQEATERASRPLFYKQRVQIHGLQVTCMRALNRTHGAQALGTHVRHQPTVLPTTTCAYSLRRLHPPAACRPSPSTTAAVVRPWPSTARRSDMVLSSKAGAAPSRFVRPASEPPPPGPSPLFTRALAYPQVRETNLSLAPQGGEPANKGAGAVVID